MENKENIPVRLGKDPDFDAWFTAFFLKNHIDPFAYPSKVGSKEQVEFMVFPEDGERYYPCSDKTFHAIMSGKYTPFLKQRYKQVYEKITAMIDELIDSDYDRQYLKTLIDIKYNDEISTGLLIPSRLEKRLHKIFLSRTHIENPYSREKETVNQNVKKFLASETLKNALNQVDESLQPAQDITLTELREKIKEIEFVRRITLLTQNHLWTRENPNIPSPGRIKKIFNTRIMGDGLAPLISLMKAKKQKILWLADESGDMVLDLSIAEFLAELGHIVILAVKESPFFKKVCLADTRTDPVLIKILENAHYIYEKTISKNNLVNLLKHDKNLYVISDGTRETLNLLLVSTTFSRIFKEVDCVITRGRSQKKRLIDSHFRFTQNIINISVIKKSLFITYKPRHDAFVKFSHQALEEKANRIIDQMKSAKKRGMTVMFYSGIIGSIPGKIDVAKKIMSTFIDYLHKQSADLFIINPSLYYEPGMDADDLMYMWEIVQRSSYIDIWRFQTSDDIAETFALLNLKVPPEWIGKDSTYSTGCTKEIRIAQEVQKENPEMQLIAPSIDKFMRRNEYGVGSMYDRRLADV
nr:protein-glutamate O-methyltransferase family protein [Desulfobacula sp.]